MKYIAALRLIICFNNRSIGTLYGKEKIFFFQFTDRKDLPMNSQGNYCEVGPTICSSTAHGNLFAYEVPCIWANRTVARLKEKNGRTVAFSSYFAWIDERYGSEPSVSLCVARHQRIFAEIYIPRHDKVSHIAHQHGQFKEHDEREFSKSSQ